LLVLQTAGALSAARDAVLAMVVVVTALGLILAPFLYRLGRTLAAERAARIRSQERAEVAAHLHDSVLQTLALVQQQAADPRAVATLARRQERELRTWLEGERAPPGQFAGALQEAAAEVEERFGVRVDVVAVGDAPLDEDLRSTVAAAREAMVNAAKFGAGPDGPAVAVFAEATPEEVSVYVRDRGPGFDPGAVPADRRGVRESIVGRMERHGGRATVRAAPGTGVEVELRLERRE
ncbi:MAG: ATP-binding protein, partial [Actinomycetota bacterium]|nr:ATP-binding protein [Actinomycetota bacterium]